MAGPIPRSTTFRAEPMTTDEQEEGVGWALAEGYTHLSGLPLTGNRKSPIDPPDRLFEWNGVLVGVEMFELDRFYAVRALAFEFQNLAYEEFARQNVGDRYLGMSINLPSVAAMDERLRLKAAWLAAGIRNGLRRAALDPVQIVMNAIPSRESLPPTVPPRQENAPSVPGHVLLTVDPVATPALAALTSEVLCIRCQPEDPRRTDGRAAPLIIVYPGYQYDRSATIRKLRTKLTDKMARRGSAETSWGEVRHSILVVHDIPRGLMYVPMIDDLEGIVREATSGLDVASVFGELLVVAYQGPGWQTTKIRGAPPGNATND